MEGLLWTRDGRKKLLRGWHKRYFVLSETSGTLHEYACDAQTRELVRRASFESSSKSSRDRTISGMTLCRELNIRGAVIKTLAFPRIGKPHAFQVTINMSEITSSAILLASSSTGVIKLVLSARHAEDMRQWITAFRAAAMRLPSFRRLSSPMTWSNRANNETGMCLNMESERDYFDITLLKRAEMVHLSSVYEWINESSVKIAQNVTIGGVHVPRGSLLVSVNGILVQTLPCVDVKRLLLDFTGPFPISLRFLRSPVKCGVLRAKLYPSPLTQLKSLAKYGKNMSKHKEWKEQVVDLAGDLLTCQVKVQPPMTIGRNSNRTTTTSKKRVLVLTSHSAVKPVHEMVSDREFCFMVTVETHSMLFQARSEADRQAWTEAVQRAITIVQGVLPDNKTVPRDGSFDLDAIQRQSSRNMRHLEQAFDGMEESEDDEESDDESLVVIPSTNNISSSSTTTTLSSTYLPERDLNEMLRVLQFSGRFIEALQLMQQHTSLRSTYWQQIFHWALDTSCTIDDTKVLFLHLLETPLSEDDALQVQKDIPRTAKWLAESAGAPTLQDGDRSVRLSHLEHVLHAFLSSCALAVRTDTSSSSAGFYMQGMNGLGFILLEVFGNDPIQAFRFLRGLVARILPHVFGLCWDLTGRDHFDLFRSLVEVGDVLQEVARLQVPQFHAILLQAGLPVCLLAYKWFPTLFSDVTLTASHSQLRFETLLACWDVCLLLGLEGMFCVALALCSAAEKELLRLESEEMGGYSAESVSAAVGRALARLSPEELVTSVCEVLELCNHPVLLKLRNAHRRRLRLGYGASSNSSSSSSTIATTASNDVGTMTVTDLDSGNVFTISTSGRMVLVPTTEMEQMKV